MHDLERYHEGARAALRQLAAEMQVRIGRELRLADAAEAHRLIETGQTVGSVLLRP